MDNTNYDKSYNLFLKVPPVSRLVLPGPTYFLIILPTIILPDFQCTDAVRPLRPRIYTKGHEYEVCWAE